MEDEAFGDRPLGSASSYVFHQRKNERQRRHRQNEPLLLGRAMVSYDEDEDDDKDIEEEHEEHQPYFALKRGQSADEDGRFSRTSGVLDKNGFLGSLVARLWGRPSGPNMMANGDGDGDGAGVLNDRDGNTTPNSAGAQTGERTGRRQNEPGQGIERNARSGYDIYLRDEGSQKRRSVKLNGSILSSRHKPSPGFRMDDHYSLRTSLLQQENVVLMNGVRHQFIFERSNVDQGDEKIHITVKRASRYGGGVVFLKVIYMYVCFVIFGFAVAFSMILLLQYALGVFLVGVISEEASEYIPALLTLFSLPIILQTLAVLLTVAVGFVGDGWNDFEFLHTMQFLPRGIREWVAMCAVLLIPLLTLGVSLIIRAERPWQNTLLTSFWCSMILFSMYSLLVVWNEITACITIVSRSEERALPSSSSSPWDMLEIFRELLWIRATRKFSFTKHFSLSSDGEPEIPLDDEETSYVYDWLKWAYRPKMQRIWNAEKIARVEPYISGDGSILYLCCLVDRRMKGKVKFTALINSAVCMLLSIVFCWMVFLGYLIYSTAFSTLSTVFISILVGFLITFSCWWKLKSLGKAIREKLAERAERRLSRKQTSKQWNTGSEDDDEQRRRANQALEQEQDVEFGGNEEAGATNDDNTGPVTSPAASSTHSDLAIDMEAVELLQASARYRVAEPKVGTAIVLELLEVSMFVIAPAIGFFALGVHGYGVMFLVASGITYTRSLFNVRGLFMVFGPETHRRLDAATVPNAERDELSGRRVYILITRLIKADIGRFWLVVLTLAALFVITLAAISANANLQIIDYDGLELYGTFSNRTHYYPDLPRQVRGFQYPSCSLFEGAHGGFNSSEFNSSRWAIIDFAFLANIAYVSSDATQNQLDVWFGNNTAQYIPEEEYPPELAHDFSPTAVFKLVYFKEDDIYLVTLRGTENTIDLLTDMQLWLPAIMFQLVRSVLPVGKFWNDLIPLLIDYVNILETAPASRIAYFVIVNQFLRAVKRKWPNSLVAVTGHSLGAGISFVTGAANQVPAIGFSGPNAKLSHAKFNVSRADLDTYAINIIPERDPFPMVDDRSLLSEDILCQADERDGIAACHLLIRTTCELMYRCGSGLRPPIRDCTKLYGYPEPEPIH